MGSDVPTNKYYKVEDKPGSAAHERNVLGPVVISVMHFFLQRSGLLGDATMQQVQAWWDLTCVNGSLGWYVAIFAVPLPCTDVPC